MASMGPQLPPHLMRSQREDNDEEDNEAGPSVGPALPPHLVNRQRKSADEEDEEDAGIGPALPPHLASRRATQRAGPEIDQPGGAIGPSLPPHLRRPRSPSPPAAIGPSRPPLAARPAPAPTEDDDDSDDYMPALPPGLRASKSAAPPFAVVPAKRVQGPSFPTGPPPARNDDSDDEIGPLPPSADDAAREMSGVEEFMERERRREESAKRAAEPKKLQRDAWMLAPPSASELLASVDPTRIKSKRVFGSGSSAAVGQSKEGLELWTETPQERLERLKAEVSGKRKRAGESAGLSAEEMDERERKRRRDEEIEARVQEHNKHSDRNASLLDMHATKHKTEKKDPKDDMIWDHERDMSLGGRLMDDGKRKDLVREAKGLGGRFERGKTGGYL